MNGVPRQDGAWTFFVIESLWNKKLDGNWSVYNFPDYFDTQELCQSLGLTYEETTLKASGKIWQESGIHGTPNLLYARVLLSLCQQHYPQHDHRIVERSVIRHSQVIKEDPIHG